MTHILIWVAFVLFFYRQLFFSNTHIPDEYWIKQTMTLFLLVIAFYINSIILVPRLLLTNHTALYLLIITGIILSVLFINRWAEDVLRSIQFSNPPPGELTPASSNDFRPRRPPQSSLRFNVGDVFIIILSILVVGISTTITALQKWQKDNQERKELEKDKITTELSLLKAQINPHFFFNTLNNIYALTAINPRIAGDAIHQLSKMMRYLLYDTQKDENMLTHEIAFVKNYVSLMKLRLTDMANITVNLPTQLNDIRLPPMIFLPFVENAFKHGISATHPSFIDITVCQEYSTLSLTIRNSIIKDNSVSLDSNNGIGLVNTQRRLDLLYPGKYKLDISKSDEANEYTVHLVLDLS